MKLPIIVLLFLSSILHKNTNGQNRIIYIKHGTSFGMCEGYCWNETKIDSLSTTTESINWKKGKRNENLTKRDTSKTENEYWDIILKSISLKKVQKMPTEIGCPDCTDGGAEWIEIGTNKKSYKIVFDFDSKVSELDKLLKILRPSCRKLEE